MGFKLFLWLIIFGTILSWLSWGLVIFNFNPNNIGPTGFMVFYLSLFLGLSGTIFLVIDLAKAKFFSNQIHFVRLKTSVRHSLFFSILIIGWLFLRGLDLLKWWNLLLLLLILVVMEFFFMSFQKQKRPHTYEGENSSAQRTI